MKLRNDSVPANEIEAVMRQFGGEDSAPVPMREEDAAILYSLDLLASDLTAFRAFSLAGYVITDPVVMKIGGEMGRTKLTPSIEAYIEGETPDGRKMPADYRQALRDNIARGEGCIAAGTLEVLEAMSDEDKAALRQRVIRRAHI